MDCGGGGGKVAAEDDCNWLIVINDDLCSMYACMYVVGIETVEQLVSRPRARLCKFLDELFKAEGATDIWRRS